MTDRCQCYTGLPHQCGQVSCDQAADYSFVWPGRGLSFICASHAPMLARIAENLGIDVILTRLTRPGDPAP